ncbi:VWA domain-containing protein [uncultured Tenacibaculum sp.]|uniref:VWA domain-containing protein n=1 Tax=uncultured Tenacibaculum sp. TaxID=174713 RepID=UPI0026234C90|nr:VWA domain-containing protein [uncultured Tenacibaculum sp.]
MQSTTLIYIVITVLCSLVIAFFQYFFKEKKQPKIVIALFILKALSLFLIGLLLINPKIDIVATQNIKPKLSVLIDNSLSTRFFKEEKKVKEILNIIVNNKELNKKYQISNFSFGNSIKVLDSLSFSETSTNISEAINSVDELVKNNKKATILITDGNQTSGNDYEFLMPKDKVFPIVLGDTTQYQDVQITQLNVNKYSYIKNKFPVEAFLLYEGKGAVSSVFTLSHNGKKIYSERIKLSSENPSKTITVNLTSKEKGLQYYQASITKLKKEKNTKNNYKSFSVEVIDEQTKVLLLSSIMHPDLGAIKKAIESNKQRKVTIEVIGNKQLNLKEYQFYVFYQPNFYFRRIFEEVSSNFLVITGTKTDWNLINSLNLGVKKNAINQFENYGAIYNDSFLTFMQDDIGFEEFPPLRDKFGKLRLSNETQILLYQKLNGINLTEPLITSLEKNDVKYAFIFGEGIWKWRSASYLKDKTFENFDTFISNIAQYLASNKKRKRLEVTSKSIYPANAIIQISAFYVDRNYKFDNRASLQLKITNSKTKEVKVLPFSLTNNAYQVSVEGLLAGDYMYQVSVENQNINKYGRFKISAYQIEEQFTNANSNKLQKLAKNSNGKLVYSNQVESLISNLLADKDYFTTQKSITTQKSLIDWKWILVLIASLLSIEWFVRKYYGKT